MVVAKQQRCSFADNFGKIPETDPLPDELEAIERMERAWQTGDYTRLEDIDWDSEE